jgi:hypothetical protein
MFQHSHLTHVPFAAKPLDNCDPTNYEQQYHLDMVAMRQRNLSSFSAESKMPFALKQRQIELPMLDYSVSLAMSSPKWRQVVVRALLENIQQGPGHLSVHRAKDGLKRIAAGIGVTNLSAMLHSSDKREAEQAAELLGWLKSLRAAQPLLKALETDHQSSKVISNVIDQHYRSYKFE